VAEARDASVFDVAVLGGNADGLAAAAALSARGRRVLLLEPSLKAGGELLTESFLTPFRFDVRGGLLVGEPWPAGGAVDPDAAGLRLLRPDAPVAFLFQDGAPLVFERGPEGLKDQAPAADYRGAIRLHDAGRRLLDRLRARLAGDDGGGTLPAAITALGSMSVRQALDHFALLDPRLRCALSYLPLAFGFEIEGPGSAPALPIAFAALSDLGVVDGGAGLLAQALADAVVARGGTLIEGFRRGRLSIDAGRRCRVALDDGRRFEAEIVLFADPAARDAWEAGDLPPAAATFDLASRDPALGIYRLFLGGAGGPLRFAAGADREAVNRACLIAAGFETEQDVHAHVAALRAGRIPPPAGHFTASAYAVPAHPVAPLAQDDGRLWCVACHTTDDTGQRAVRRAAWSATIWQGLLPLAPRVLDPDAFRVDYARRCVRSLRPLFAGADLDGAALQLLWLPEDTREPLRAIDWLALTGTPAGELRQHYRTASPSVLVNPFAPLAALSGLATGRALAEAAHEVVQASSATAR
jgi:hypothetical protein